MTLTITDPCLTTTILSRPVPNIAADIDKEFSLNMKNFEWPWKDAVDESSALWGSDKCGVKNYFVTDNAGQPVPFVELKPDGTLSIKPIDTRDTPGEYSCVLHAEIDGLTLIFASQVFSCDIPKCTPVINPNGARGPD